jgi:CDP-diacylglycerol---glycerol-3-phosphate 3-phosphatidyltransferase
LSDDPDGSARGTGLLQRLARAWGALGAWGGPAVAAAKARLQHDAHAAVRPLVELLVQVGVTPNHLTITGLVCSLLSGFLFFEGQPALGALMLAVAGLCDILDGEVARRAGVVSKFGAFLDSTLDRLSEAVVLLGIMGFYLSNLPVLVRYPLLAFAQRSHGLDPETWAGVAFMAALALVGSFLVSYTRARAEGLGIDCKVGWFERPERTVLLIVAGLAAGAVRRFWPLPAALMLLAVLSFATAVQRVAHVYRVTRRAGVDQLGG